MKQLPYIRSKPVRDLLWSCFGPELIDNLSPFNSAEDIANCHLLLTAPRLAWLHQLDADPGPLEKHLTAYNIKRLGIYFEALWHFFRTKSTPDKA